MTPKITLLYIRYKFSDIVVIFVYRRSSFELSGWYPVS